MLLKKIKQHIIVETVICALLHKHIVQISCRSQQNTVNEYTFLCYLFQYYYMLRYIYKKCVCLHTFTSF